MLMTGKEVPVYLIDGEPNASEHVVAHGTVDEQPCSLSVIRNGGDHLLVATVNGKRVAVSGTELLGAAANLQEVPHV